MLVDGCEEAEGSVETLGTALTDGALEVVGCSDGTRDGAVDVDGMSEGIPVGMLEVEGAEVTEGSSETLGFALLDGALEVDGLSDGAKEGDVDVEGTSEGTPVGMLDILGPDETEGSVKTLGLVLTDGALEVVGCSNGASNGAVDVDGMSEGAPVGLEETLGASKTWIVGPCESVGSVMGPGVGSVDTLSASEGAFLEDEGRPAASRPRASR